MPRRPITTAAAHVTGMPGTLTLDGAAELAATLAHTSALLEIDDAGYPAFTTLTPHLTDKDRYRHWERLLDAANRQFALDDPRTGAAAALDLLDNALAAGDSTSTLLGLDTDVYVAVNPSDRPGENDYDGYDIHAFAVDLASRWDAELVRRARSAVERLGTGRLYGFCQREDCGAIRWAVRGFQTCIDGFGGITAAGTQAVEHPRVGS